MLKKRLHAATAALLISLAGVAEAQPEKDLGLSPERSMRSIEALAPVNAALVYYQLFIDPQMAAISNAADLVREERDAKASQPGARERLQELLAENRLILDRFTAAAALPECDFGIQYQHGWLAELPHLGRLRTAALALGADARRLAAAGDTTRASERIAAMYHIARHVRQDPLVITSLVSMAITDEANAAVADLEAIDALTPGDRSTVISAIDRFGREDPYQTRRAAWMEGVVTVGWLARTYPNGGFASGLIALGLFDATLPAEQIARLDAMTAENLRTEADLMGNFYRAALEQWNSDQAVAAIKTLEARASRGEFGVLTQHFAASLARCKEREIAASRELFGTRDRLARGLPRSKD